MKSESGTLEHECYVFTAYLIGQEPSSYVVEKYLDAHGIRLGAERGDLLERWLLYIGGRSKFLTRAADGYARHFAPDSSLRRRLAILAAILETSPSFSRMIDSEKPLSIWMLGWRAASCLLGSVASLLLGVLLCEPVRVYSLVGGRSSCRRRE